MSFTHLWDNERTKRNFNYNEPSAQDAYKPKDYASNYNISTKPTTREQAQHRMDYSDKVEMQYEYKPKHYPAGHSNSDLG